MYDEQIHSVIYHFCTDRQTCLSLNIAESQIMNLGVMILFKTTSNPKQLHTIILTETQLCVCVCALTVVYIVHLCLGLVCSHVNLSVCLTSAFQQRD